MTTKHARTRFAPSPTGHLHLGGARTALYAYLLAKKTGGQFLLRIEDTDIKRTVPGAEQEIMDGLRWLGLNYDEGPDIGGKYGPYRQTERREIYQAHAKTLVENGHAYPCFCTPEHLDKVRQEQMKRKENPRYDGTCRVLSADEAAKRIANGEPYTIRFKVPYEGSTVAHDHLRGDITIENKQLNDQVILKTDGMPTYHLAAMVDDHEMQITHVIRGSEWLGTFPLHVNIVRAFGWEEPVWAHLSVFLKPSGKGKMSKRDAPDAMKDGYSVFIKDMQDLGFTPEGVLNWCALMGWGVAEDDVMTVDQMVDRFTIDSLTPSPAAVNFQRLDHFNATHIRLFTTEDLAARIKPYFTREGLKVDDGILLKIVPLIRERLTTLDDCLSFGSFFFKEDVSPAPADLIAKGLDAKQSAQIAQRAYEILVAQPDISHERCEPPLRAYVEESGLNANQVFGILRVATTGQKVSPPLFESMEIIGREKCLARIKSAIELLEKM
ncbi:MAG TPA: glutamate--tRNA ligase [Anaerolineales bacterium]|nr:glutamate--tRNA ligase [Anaerolineales bacterium]HMZ42929.1 glutamate--tRNA ligase [Anaerolineales bacterium]HNC89544.1 glutamate--tRNA ligase [Anaerolineales bacterium]HND92054.1 glutamate--tRNA ligase [Anaerolineales bacterium]HNH04657.1 glutamate--tRNA ligase [Anaerolineales bacterium]